MTKEFSLFIIGACLFFSGIGLFWYNGQTRQKTDLSSPVVLEANTPKKIETTTTASSILPDVPPFEPPSFSLLAVGDIMLDRSVMLKTQAAGDYNHPFLLVDPLFEQYDLRLANLEGPITNFQSIANGTGGARFTFTFSPNFVEPLKQRFEFLSLANNHAYNFGQKGFEQTHTFLDAVDVVYFGTPDNRQNTLSVTSSQNGITFGFLGYHQLVEQGFENVLAEAKHLDEQVDFLIAMPHWGIEYEENKPSWLQQKEAHEMVDAGVDLIIGAHPHVVQPIEVYKEKVIFYSLGNFIFDQYFSEATMTGLAIGMEISKPETGVEVEYSLIPLDINTKSQPSVAESSKKERVLRHLSTVSLVDEEIKADILTGMFRH